MKVDWSKWPRGATHVHTATHVHAAACRGLPCALLIDPELVFVGTAFGVPLLDGDMSAPHQYLLSSAVEKRELADTEKVVDTVMRHYLASGQVVSELPDIIRAAAGGKL